MSKSAFSVFPHYVREYILMCIKVKNTTYKGQTILPIATLKLLDSFVENKMLLYTTILSYAVCLL